MKKIAIIILGLLVSTCSKSDDSSIDESSQIFGKWEMYSYVYDDGLDYFDDDESNIFLHQIEFISPDTYLMKYPSEDDSYTSEEIGNFSIAGSILTLNSEFLDGLEYENSTIYTEFEVQNDVLEYKENISRFGMYEYGRAYYKKIN